MTVTMENVPRCQNGQIGLVVIKIAEAEIDSERAFVRLRTDQKLFANLAVRWFL